MTRPSDLSDSSLALLERAKHTLQSLQYHEQAARYKAAAASLQAAMVHAENGRPEVLQQWLELKSDASKLGLSLSEKEFSELYPAELDAPVLEPFETELFQSELESERLELATDMPPSKRFARVDQPLRRASVVDPNCLDKLHASPWSKMEQAATERLAERNNDPNIAQDDANIDLDTIELDKKTKAINTPKVLDPVPEWISQASFDWQSKPMHLSSWWKAPHLWVSMLVHIVLLVCLGLIAITVAKTPPLLSIVSSPVDAENVLMEAPMEINSQIEESTDSPAALLSMTTPSVPEFNVEVALDGFSLDVEKSASEPMSIASAVRNETSESASSAKVGSQMLAGAEFFGAKATGNTFVYVIDSSPSMRRGGAFEAARQEIVRSLRSMKPKQRYFLSFFGKEIDPMVLESGVVERFPIYAKPENLDKTIDWLGRVQVQKEGLPPNNALTEAIAMQPDAIFLLFDGDTKVDVAKFLQRANRSEDIISRGTPKVPIHVIHFFQEEFQAQMKRIADENGGTYRFVSRPERSSKGNR